MTGMSSVGLGEHFGNSVDPRGRQGKRHQLLDIITMTIWAITGGPRVGMTWGCLPKASMSG